MASAFQSNAFQNNAFQIVVTPTPTPEPEVPARMYGGGGFGGAYRVRDEDVERLMGVLFKVRKKRKRKKAKARDFEEAAIALLNVPDIPAIRQIIVDSATPLLRAQARQADLQAAVEALLARAVQLHEEYERELAEDEEDVLMLLGAMQ